MNILVIGGTGFISSSIVERLLADGHRVTVFNRGRSEKPAFKGNIHFHYGDRRMPSSLAETVNRQTFDAVFDMVAYEPLESRTAAQIFRGKVGRFIHCSTVSVYMVSELVRCPITEDQDRLPIVDEWPGNPFGHDYGLKKRQCEDELWKAHHNIEFPVTMLRPTFVCGPGDPMRRDWFWIQRILDGRPLLVPGTGDHAFQMVYVEDVARAFVDALKSADAAGHAYNVAAEEIMSLNDYIGRLALLLNRAPEVSHVDQDIFEEQPFSTSTAGDAFPFNTQRTAVFSLDRIKKDLGYRSTPFDRWMEKTIEWYRMHMSEPSVGYESRSKEVAFAERWTSIRRQLKMATFNGSTLN